MNSILGQRSSIAALSNTIASRDVFAVGSGPSLHAGLEIMVRHPYIVRVVADSAVTELVRRHMRIDVVVTDLDGDASSLTNAARSGAVMVVHAHGDNVDRLSMAREFPMMVGTTQGRPVGAVHNFGGFTDGDRCVFVAAAMRARSVTLLGMDFGSRIGRHSMTRRSNRAVKIRKLQRARDLLEWAAPKISAMTRLHTMSGNVAGFARVTARSLTHDLTHLHRP